MDGSRLDALLRVFQSTRSRRGAGAALAASVLSGARFPAAAKSCRKATDCGECQTCRKKKCRKSPDGASCPGGACRKGRCVDPCDACGPTEQCIDGQCRCKDGLASCGKQCVDILGSRANCGACGNTCPAGHSCCGGSCVDLAASVEHCGACGNGCPYNEQCTAGACTCGLFGYSVAPRTCCVATGFGVCVDADAPSQILQADTCLTVASCPPGYTTCVGATGTAPVTDTCRVCCPPGYGCDAGFGYCRIA